uniref:Uncharacterized protein n=1 Tax=Romanomermis culicivorax TaxID=13658 RepID=A0A915K348_ROMCU
MQIISKLSFDVKFINYQSLHIRRSSLTVTNLSSRQTDDQISDERIFGFAATMRYHDTPAILTSQLAAELQAFLSTAVWIRLGLVTVKSSLNKKDELGDIDTGIEVWHSRGYDLKIIDFDDIGK